VQRKILFASGKQIDMLLRSKHMKYCVYGIFDILFIQCCFISAQDNVATLKT